LGGDFLANSSWESTFGRWRSVVSNKCGKIGLCAMALVLSLATCVCAQAPNLGPKHAAYAKIFGEQQKVTLAVRVVDPDGKPVAKAKVSPWALRSSQGHGQWRKNDQAEFDPVDVVTDAAGGATIVYPFYRHWKEQIRTLAVSLSIDHPNYAYVDMVEVEVPVESKEPYVLNLRPGCPLEVRPLLDGKPAGLDNLYAQWSDGRTWKSGVAPEKLADGVLRIAALPPGRNSVLLAKLVGNRATHFSRITDVELQSGKPNRIDVRLRPSLRVAGVLSKNVPRPVRNGRLKAWTLPRANPERNRAEWFTWVPIQPDGTFAIDGWPAEEPMQLIALCDGYIATSGKPPAVVNPAQVPKQDPFSRPQVFEPVAEKRIELQMTVLATCVATAVDEEDKPIAGVTVNSWPNVGWWNIGSQIYCSTLVRGERLLQVRDYDQAIDKAFAEPFEGRTDAKGRVTLQLPAGTQRLAVTADVYELPAFLGRREVMVSLAGGQTKEAVLRLVPRGAERLGDWDKLAGVVFGCSTREGRRICALPGVRKQMDEFTNRFREAKNQRDPKLLSEAYAAVADAFRGVGDQEEAAKWRQRALSEAAKVRTTKPPATN
jgi:hypothetical protein